MLKNILLGVLLLTFTSKSQSQNIRFEQYGPVVVKKGNTILTNPFGSGINNPQFSEIDLNFDGKKDLVVFDRLGNKINCFINKGTPGTINYEYDFSYAQYFPPLSDWALFADYNGDGKEDIFTSASGGSCKVYRNVSNPTDGIRFELINKELFADYSSYFAPLYVHPMDVPAIIDIDNDGDLDIIAFEYFGTSVYLYKNIGLEKYQNIDSLEFIVDKRCWGRFKEDPDTCVIYLTHGAPPCNTGQRLSQEPNIDSLLSARHQGSTLLVADLNGDHLLDALIGDVGCENLHALINTNSNSDPIMTQAIYQFPVQDPISLETFPVPFLVDVNNDGLKDLIVSANLYGGLDNTNNILLYLDKGSNGIPNYVLETKEFLKKEMIDVGQGAFPHLFDYNNDGLLDLLIGREVEWKGNSNYSTGLTLYQNTGTPSVPAFEWVTDDFEGLSALNISAMAPTTGDVDNDGDLDLICGSSDGKLYFFRNIAGPANTVKYVYDSTMFNDSYDVGSFSSPILYDFNKDQQPDLLIGERYDNINYYQGSATSPYFNYVTDSLGGIKVQGRWGSTFVYSSLAVDHFKGDSTDILVASNPSSRLYFYELNTTDPYTKPLFLDSIDMHLGDYYYSTGGFGLASGDLDGDGLPELMIGTPAGGLVLLKNVTQLPTGITTEKAAAAIRLHPNPASDRLYISGITPTNIRSVELVDMLGKQQLRVPSSALQTGIDLSRVNKGMYIVRIQTNDYQVISKKIMIIR